MTVAYRAASLSTGGSPLIAAVPSTVQAGDVLLVAIALQTAMQPAAPAGWALISGATTSWFYWRVATASDAGQSYGWGTPGSYGTILLAAYENTLGSKVDVMAATAADNVTSGTTKQVTTTLPADMIVALWALVNPTAALSVTYPSSGITMRYEQGINAGGIEFGAGGVGDASQAGAGASAQFTATANQLSNWSMLTVALYTVLPPAAPTLTSPGSGAYLDTSGGGVTLSGVYNSRDGQNQNAYALRVKTAGAASYSYYNAGSGALQSTIVWNPVSTAPGGTFSVTLASTVVPDGSVYNWSFASQEAGGNLQGPFAADQTFTAENAPNLTIDSPVGTAVVANPLVSWTASPAAGDYQTAWQVVVEHGSFGTTPGSGTQDWNSGVVPGAAQQTPVGVNLANQQTYRVFVQITETGNLLSGWQYATFTVTFDAPAAPSITAVAGVDPATGCPRVVLTVTGNDNLLPAADASVENATVGGWSAGVNTTVAAVETYGAVDGLYSLTLTNSSGGTATVSVSTRTGSAGYPVLSAASYTLWCAVKAAATGRACTLSVNWYTAAGALISTSSLPAVNDTTGGFTTISGHVTSPATAAFAALTLSIAGTAASEVHAGDTFGLFPGTATAWTAGGFAGNTQATITRSDGLQVRDASTSTPLTLPTPDQQATVNDYEAQPGVTYTYTAQTQLNINGDIVTSGSSGLAAATSIPTSAWVFDVADVTTATQALIASFPATVKGVAGGPTVFLGNPQPGVALDVFQLRQGTLTLITLDETTSETLQTLLAQPGHVYCLLRPPVTGAPTGFLMYFTVTGPVAEGKVTEALLGATGGSTGQVLRNTRERFVSVPFAEQNRPAV